MRADEYVLNINRKCDDSDGCDGICMYINIVTIDTIDTKGAFYEQVCSDINRAF